MPRCEIRDEFVQLGRDQLIALSIRPMTAGAAVEILDFADIDRTLLCVADCGSGNQGRTQGGACNPLQ